jgi:hypothetical protein
MTGFNDLAKTEEEMVREEGFAAGYQTRVVQAEFLENTTIEDMTVGFFFRRRRNQREYHRLFNENHYTQTRKNIDVDFPPIAGKNGEFHPEDYNDLGQRYPLES